jgi:hypothetical protein
MLSAVSQREQARPYAICCSPSSEASANLLLLTQKNTLTTKGKFSIACCEDVPQGLRVEPKDLQIAHKFGKKIDNFKSS